MDRSLDTHGADSKLGKDSRQKNEKYNSIEAEVNKILIKSLMGDRRMVQV